MKRFRTGEGEVESLNMANVLMLLSRGGGDHGEEEEIVNTARPSRVFECKTCNRQFPSFQALGGHRASHKKPRLMGSDQNSQAQGGLAKPRVHECSICGLEFAIGQALGGHMRRHRASTEGFGHGLVENKPNGKRVLCLDLDLNLPPMEEIDDIECRKLGFGLELVDKMQMVGCFH